ncbi:MAG: sugar transferase [Erysipelotrichaceae bacterium]|nr:sugar transferase [Erysipelotrichaceae bacterium]
MMLRKWEQLPDFMKNEKVRAYYDILSERKASLLVKRLFDFSAALILLILLSPIMLVTALAIRADSHGPVFYRQRRVTRYGKVFLIHKFRSMIVDAENRGNLLTVKGDDRITKVGKFIRKYRIDEFPQLLDIISGNMSFVGTRPEVEKYVAHYTDEMYATLLMPAGITSRASILYLNEDRLLMKSDDLDRTYIEEIMPEKMKYNLEMIRNFSLIQEFGILFKTVKETIR